MASGLAGIWLDEAAALKAAQKVREMGFQKFEAITPYPVHGMEEACGIPRSPIPWVTFFAGLSGCGFGLWLTWWTSSQDWPINIGGKPFFSLPAFIPVIFELTILFAALSSVAALFYFTKMPKIDPPVIDPDLTSHKFAIYVPSTESGFSEAKLTQLFRELGAVEIKKVGSF